MAIYGSYKTVVRKLACPTIRPACNTQTLLVLLQIALDERRVQQTHLLPI